MLTKLIILLVFIGLISFIIWGATPEYDKCYTDMENTGYASMCCCGGLTGGDRSTNYLSETCIGCPYLVLVNDRKEEK